MKIPSNEKIVVNYVFEDVKCYIATHNVIRGKYTLYKIIDGDYQRLKVSDSPLEFYEIIEEDRSEI